MIVPLTLGDFLERAELVYGAREAVVSIAIWMIGKGEGLQNARRAQW